MTVNDDMMNVLDETVNKLNKLCMKQSEYCNGCVFNIEDSPVCLFTAIKVSYYQARNKYVKQ